MGNKRVNTMTQEAAFDGQPARFIRLENSLGMSATFMDIGATWLSCTLPVNNLDREVLLGTSSMADFEKMSAYMGVTVGRYANRIAKGQFVIDGHQYQLEVNQAGNTLHGGVKGFNAYRWNVEEQGADFVQFALFSADGDQGFPGNVNCSVRYTLTNDNEVIIQYLANTDKATPVNLTNHAYFNLMGESSGIECTSYSLQINAQHYLPTDSVGIPLGDLMPVAGTSFDFQQEKTVSSDFLADDQQKNAQGYDHSFYLNSSCQKGDCAALVTTEDKSITMKVFTDKPAVQLYTGNWLDGEPNKDGGSYKNYAGIALETQFLPDSPNHPEWQQQSSILLPEQEYRFKTIYQFEFER